MIMDQKLLKQIEGLRIYNLLLTAILIAVLFLSFKNNYGARRFEEIDVERINIIEKDGTLKMVVTNQERQPEAITNGVKMKGRGKAPGIILYNSVGDECGGFLFSGDSSEAGQILTFDQYKQDQIMSLQYNENSRNGKRQRLYGLAISNRPDTITSDQTYLKRKRIEGIKDAKLRQTELAKLDTSGIYGSNRLFVGKAWNDNYGMYLNDDKGRKKARFFIDKSNQAKLEFYDNAGNVVSSYPK
jgi:hypothetical protein